MNKYIVFSLIAIAPLMLRAENTFIEEVESLESLFESESEPLLSVEEPVVLAESKQLNTPPEVPSSSSSWECRPDIQPYQISVGHIEGKGVGYDTGYTTLDAFFTRAYGRYIPFLDLKGHVFDNGRLAANLGLGIRYAWKPEKYLFGVNGYYDYRQTKHGHYNQAGAGIEAFKNRWEFRANGYLPMGKKKFVYDKNLTDISFKGFQGHYILINEFYDQKVEYAMKGFNAELGKHLIAPRPNYDLYLGAGTYYFIGDVGKNTWGGKIRLTGKVTKYISLEISDSFDRVFHNRFQGQVVFNYPFGSKKLRPQKRPNPATCYTDNLMYARASQPVQRQDILVVNHKKQPFVIDPIAIDPTTGQPFFVVFVNNANPNPGDGTFENPYTAFNPVDNPTANVFSGSAPGNTIYVFPGNGPLTPSRYLTTGQAISAGVPLQKGQRFLGSSISNTYLTTKGVLVIPPQTANMPQIQGPSNANFAVQLADNTEVSGFQLNNPAGISASIGINPTLTNGVITRNVINGGVVGIKLGAGAAMQGNWIVTNNTVTGVATTAGGEAVGIRAIFANGSALISENVCSNGTSSSSNGGASGIAISTYNSGFPLSIDVLNNQTNNNENTGLRVSFFQNIVGSSGTGGSICVNIDGNTADGNGDPARTGLGGATPVGANGGIVVTSTIGAGSGFSVPHVIINNNTATNNVPYTAPSSSSAVGGGIFVGTVDGAIAESDLCARVTNNISTLSNLVTPAQGGPADFEFSSLGTFPNSFFLEPLTGNVGTWFSNGTLIMTDAGDCSCP